MMIQNLDRSMMMIFLLEHCNFSCEHCVREDEPMPPGYKLSFEQLGVCLSDCQNLKTVECVHFSGGEPTLWNDGKRDLVDLLIEISKAGFEPGFTTNGSYFNDYTKCQEFFNKYFDNVNKRLRLFISIDTFHKNYDVGKGRSKNLDNAIRYKQEILTEKGDMLPVIVLVTVSRSPKSLLPAEMIEHYEFQGVEFNFVPLGFKGKAKSLGHLCPDMESDNPEDLGAYYSYHQKNKDRELKSNFILIGNDYYCYDYDYSIEFTQCWHKVAKLGNLT